jgi:predicted nucleic acid-binding protein
MLYLDTNILIYLLEGHETYAEAVADTLEEYAQSGGTFITSTIAITEFLAGTGSVDLTTLRQIPRLQFVTLDELLAERAALLQKKEGLQIGDAIHLASAIQGQADFFTNDKILARAAKQYMAVRAL